MNTFKNKLSQIENIESRSQSGLIYELETHITELQSLGYSLEDIHSEITKYAPSIKLNYLSKLLYRVRLKKQHNKTKNNAPKDVESTQPKETQKIKSSDVEAPINEPKDTSLNNTKTSSIINTEKDRLNRKQTSKELLQKHKRN